MSDENEGGGKLLESRAVRLVLIGTGALLLVALANDMKIDAREQARIFDALENWILALILKWGAEDVAKKLPMEWGKGNGKAAASVVINENGRGP